MTADLNKLIGIPFKLNRKDFDGCDCRGIVYLYFQYAKNRIVPFTDGKTIFFRNPKFDLLRMYKILDNIAYEISFSELKQDDVLILKAEKNFGALGVCINDKQVLHMDKFVGSCLTKLRYLKDMFIKGYRLND
jgi:hypothetical protein